MQEMLLQVLFLSEREADAVLAVLWKQHSARVAFINLSYTSDCDATPPSSSLTAIFGMAQIKPSCDCAWHEAVRACFNECGERTG